MNSVWHVLRELSEVKVFISSEEWLVLVFQDSGGESVNTSSVVIVVAYHTLD